MRFQEFLQLQDEIVFNSIDDNIKGYQGKGTVTESSQTMRTAYSFLLPNKVKIEVDLPDGGTYVEGFDGQQAWELNSFVNGEAEAALRHGAEWINPLKSVREFMERGHSVDYHGIAKIEGVQHYHLELTQSDGMSRDYYFDVSQLVPVIARDRRPLHPGEQSKELEIRFLDYEMVDGVNFAFRQVEKEVHSPKPLLEVRYEEILTLESFAANFFEKLDRKIWY